MLSLEQIVKIGRMDAQYGEPEQTFSPAWHAENPVTPHGGATAGARIERAGRSVSIKLRNVLDANTGDVRIVHDDGTPLPEGVTYLD